MKPATLTGPHPTDCSGCPACSHVAAALLANPENPVLIETMSHPHLRALGERLLSEPDAPPIRREVAPPPDGYRTALDHQGSPAYLTTLASAEQFDPQSGYGVGLRELAVQQAASVGVQLPAVRTAAAAETTEQRLEGMAIFRRSFYQAVAPTSLRAAARRNIADFEPPDPYRAGIEEMRRQGR